MVKCDLKSAFRLNQCVTVVFTCYAACMFRDVPDITHTGEVTSLLGYSLIRTVCSQMTQNTTMLS